MRDPEKAILSDECRGQLATLADLVPTAIVSGRRIERVVKFVQLQQLFYAGSHGLDIQVPPPRLSLTPRCRLHRSLQRLPRLLHLAAVWRFAAAGRLCGSVCCAPLAGPAVSLERRAAVLAHERLRVTCRALWRGTTNWATRSSVRISQRRRTSLL